MNIVHLQKKNPREKCWENDIFRPSFLSFSFRDFFPFFLFRFLLRGLSIPFRIAFA